ncbi:AbiH family protein [Lentilactobacillus parakefiri]|uniref:Bacteriophage abortive infection AbiH n=1 Tax=Lentilactobacillus parakefiri TaxID=152332 RepID=A0A224VIW7_9LACO|nr:AbiH family protein [Lentilactobacillus parakefiri]KRL74367.1 hypothetical protein FD08_GL001862 [Lentilactobacillus parakefiri DSM 10551]TDG88796.1 hypothetical protein C5L28_002143 [Lentilactobacillus parakefiri]GAW73033.1 hypothetical protein LPKJCM_02166 [Lentilactobacillus parakefiri]
MNQNKFSNNEDNPEKLLIIGNGFDLECGLQSNIKDYINFLASIKKIRFDKKNISIEDDELNEDIEEVLKTSPSTTSVEQGLKFFDDLKGKNSVNFENLTISFWDLVFLDYHKKSKNWNDVENAISNFSTNYTGFPYIYPQLHSLLNKFYLFASQNNKKFVEYLTSENFLFTELKKFEGNFKCYLEEAVKKSESTNSYKKNSIRLLNKLTDNKKYNIPQLSNQVQH